MIFYSASVATCIMPIRPRCICRFLTCFSVFLPNTVIPKLAFSYFGHFMPLRIASEGQYLLMLLQRAAQNILTNIANQILCCR